MAAKHPWQNSVDHCSNEGRRCNKREEKVVTRRGGGCIEMEVQGGTDASTARYRGVQATSLGLLRTVHSTGSSKTHRTWS